MDKGWIIASLENSDFVANLEMVPDVYKTPYNADIPVVCMNESPKQLIRETHLPIAEERRAVIQSMIMNMSGAV